jgi:hypothetical protein
MVFTVLVMAGLTAYYWGLKRAGQVAVAVAGGLLPATIASRYHNNKKKFF